MTTPEPIHIEHIRIEMEPSLTYALTSSGVLPLVGLALGIGIAILAERIYTKRKAKKKESDSGNLV